MEHKANTKHTKKKHENPVSSSSWPSYWFGGDWFGLAKYFHGPAAKKRMMRRSALI